MTALVFVLILLPYKGGAHSIEFDNQTACEQALAHIKQQHQHQAGPLIAFCTPKE